MTINCADMDKLMLILQQVTNDNAIFLNVYRDVQTRIAQGNGNYRSFFRRETVKFRKGREE